MPVGILQNMDTGQGRFEAKVKQLMVRFINVAELVDRVFIRLRPGTIVMQQTLKIVYGSLTFTRCDLQQLIR